MPMVFFAACGGIATSGINDNTNKGTATNGAAAGENATIDSHRTFRVDYTSEPGQIQFSPEEAGEISFACGMNMMKGKVLVQ